MATLFLKPGRDKSVRQHHPWIFSGAVERIKGTPAAGETVEVYDTNGQFLARAAFNPKSKIMARIWTWNEEEEVNVDFFRRRLNRALDLRHSLGLTEKTDALRLVHAESDHLPGIIVDRYADNLVLQCLTVGAEYWRDVLVELLLELTGYSRIYERSDVEARLLEGLDEKTGLLHGDDLPQRVQIQENGLKFWVDIQKGQKTGFFLDQRDNRKRLRDFSLGRSVLNCFCYTGAFTVYALAGGATDIISIDSSSEALKIGSENTLLNGFSPQQATWVDGDVFYELRSLRDRARSFDLIILDPPKFAPTAAQAERASRGYKDINLLAFKLLRPGGLLFTFSCSGGISEDLFKKIVTGAAQDAGVDAVIIDYLHQGADHPVSLNFPEGSYLKGFVCRV